MASSVLNFLLVGNDAGASRAIARLGAAAEATSASIAKASDKQAAAAARVSKAFNAVGKASTLVAIGIGVAGVKAAIDFESALTRVSTQAGVSKGELKGLGDALLKLSPKVGFNPDDLATSLYHVESAFRTTGISAQNAIAIVEQASKLSKIGNADLETTTQAIIGVLASKIGGVKNAQDAAAQLNQLVGTGDTTLQKVAQSIATGILPTAATLGLTFKDVAAGLATLTDNVTPADTAARILKTSLLTLIKPSQQQVTAFQEIGLGALQLGQDFRQPNGLLVGVTDLKKHLDATFPAGQKTALTIQQLDGAQKSYYDNLVSSGTNVKDATKQSLAFRDSITGVSTATLRANAVARALGGSKTAGTFLTFIQEIDRLQSKYKDFGTSTQAATKFQQAWVQQQGTAKQKLAELDASWHVFLVSVGNAILPDLKKVLDVLAKHPQAIQNVVKAIAIFAGAWAAVKVASIVASLGRIATAFFGVATAAGTAATAEAGVATAGAGAGAGAVGAAGAARYAIPAAGGRGLALGAAGKVLLPVAITIVGIKTAQNAQKILKDLGEHQYGKALTDGLNNAIINGLTFGISGGIAKAIKSGDWVKALGPGAGLVQKLLGGALPGGALSGKLGPDFGKLTKDAEGYWAAVDDRARIKDFGSTLGVFKNLIDGNSTALAGNSTAAQTNRSALELLASKAKDGADAQLRLTGKQSDYTAALRIGIGQIEGEATALGFNKQQVDFLLAAWGLVPPAKTTTYTTPGVDTALVNLQNIKDALDRIPLQKQVDISVIQTGSAPDVLIAQAAGGTGHGLGAGRFASGGVAKGWAWVGEHGKELIHVGSPSRVLPHGESMAVAGARPGGDTYVTVNLSALDTKTAEQALRGGLAKTIATEIKRAQGQGFTLN